MHSLHQHASLMPVLAAGLHNMLQGFELLDAFAPAREEAVLVFGSNNEVLSIKLNTEAKTGLLFFYEHRIERQGNVYPLFKQLTGCIVVDVFAHPNNRSFALNFTNGMQLVFKLYGPLSNIVLFDADKVCGLFKQGIENDWLLQRNSFSNEQQAMEPLCEPLHYYVYKEELAKGTQIALRVEPNEAKLMFESEVLFEALGFFAGAHLNAFHFNERRQALINRLKQALKRQQALLNNAQTRLMHLGSEVPPAEIANILMANAHAIKKGETEVTLHDFYRDQPIAIKLKKDLDVHANAEHYYRKSKNRKKEWAQAEAQVISATAKAEELSMQLEEALIIADHKALRTADKESGSALKLGEKPVQNPSSQFKQFSCQGYSIYVGKSSANNDDLTLKFAHNNDLWLHARGVSGSHVVIKHKNKSEVFPTPVIEFAAQLAAYYSKSKSSTLVPVIYTHKKFVRKPKGALAGQVKVEREEVIMVEPKLPG